MEGEVRHNVHGRPAFGEDQLSVSIDEWHESELAAGNSVPDFWDENNTGDRLAEYLWSLGYRKIRS